MQFSRRTAWVSGENEWTEARQNYQAQTQRGVQLIDLTVSNPTVCGLGPDGGSILAPLANPAALRYTPDPRGMPAARGAVAAYYRDAGAAMPPENLCLTTSTSEAYSFLFRLLCDPGDEVLIARPSYPLFNLLAQLDDVVLREYPLHYDPGAIAARGEGWSLDLQALQEAITPRTRAIVVVHPNNPTGNYASASERQALQTLCAERQLALIVDEVFLDYSIGEAVSSAAVRSFAVEANNCLCFILSGLSKICALPQMKLSWIATCGPPEMVQAALERLEIIADTFLSLNAPVQFALPHWLAARHVIQARIRERLALNLEALDASLSGSMASRLSVEGGWTAVLRVPSTVEGEEFSLAAIRRGVLVQPGSLYGLPPGRCVLSLLTPPLLLTEGLGRLPVGLPEGNRRFGRTTLHD